MRRALAALSALWLLLATPLALAQPAAWATTYGGGNQITAPTLLGSASGSGFGSVPTALITTSANAPTGQPVVVLTLSGSTSGTASAIDAVTNTYIADLSLGIGSGLGGLYVANPTALPSGDTITLSGESDSSSLTVVAGIAVSIPGAKTSSPVDNIGTTTSASSAAPSVTENTPTSANRIVFGEVVQAGATVTEAAGWTTLGTVTASAETFHVAYKIVSTLTAQTYAPPLSGNVFWNANTFSIKSK